MIQVDPNGVTASFVPFQPLAIGRGHSVYLANLKDTSGNALSYSFGFTTGFSPDSDVPHLLATSPAGGAVNIPTNAQIVLEFNEPLNAISVVGAIQVTGSGQNISGALALSDGNRRVTFTPGATYTANSLQTVTVAGTITDDAGFALDNPGTFSFQTGAGTNNQPPTITTVSPGNGAAGVPTNAVVQIGFSERIDALTVNSGTFVVYPQATGIPIGGTYGVSGDGLSATFTPSAPLQPSTGYSISVSGVADLVGQQTSVFTNFTTGAGTQPAALTVLHVSPPHRRVRHPLTPYVAAWRRDP